MAGVNVGYSKQPAVDASEEPQVEVGPGAKTLGELDGVEVVADAASVRLLLPSFSNWMLGCTVW